VVEAGVTVTEEPLRLPGFQV
jgi:hypothetical protein